MAPAGAADGTSAVWSLPSVLSCSPVRMPQSLSTQQAGPAVQQMHAVSAMVMDPVGELLAAAHCDGTVSVWNCSKHGTAETGL
jgi:WD40 repeat protein